VFLLRQARLDDAPSLFKLARMVHFINLPADREVIEDKIRWSEICFRAARRGEPDPDPSRAGLRALGGAAGASPQHMFVVEDLTTGAPLGCSVVIARMGAPGSPNVYLRLRKRSFFSQDLQTGATHVTAQLVLDESGPSEIGALILAPSFRSRPEKLGKQLSFVRFHYIALHRQRFQDAIVAEMMAPITPEGRNSFWEHFGRRFINLSYDEADRFCAKSREFMTSLLPREEIYLTLLPPQARALVGKVGRDTQPAKAMLERLGFVHNDLVDPFDAGPILEARTDDISLVQATRALPFVGECDEGGLDALVSVDDEPTGGFRALRSRVELDDAGVKLPPAAVSTLQLPAGATLGVTPLEEPAKAAQRRAAARRPSTSSKTSSKRGP